MIISAHFIIQLFLKLDYICTGLALNSKAVRQFHINITVRETREINWYDCSIESPGGWGGRGATHPRMQTVTARLTFGSRQSCYWEANLAQQTSQQAQETNDFSMYNLTVALNTNNNYRQCRGCECSIYQAAQQLISIYVHLYSPIQNLPK